MLHWAHISTGRRNICCIKLFGLPKMFKLCPFNDLELSAIITKHNEKNTAYVAESRANFVGFSYVIAAIWTKMFDFMLIFPQGIDNFTADLNALHPILTECRVLKSGLELALIQFANDISSEAHVEVNILELVPCDMCSLNSQSYTYTLIFSYREGVGVILYFCVVWRIDFTRITWIWFSR